MARHTEKLKALSVRSLTKPGRYNDGNGLYLFVTARGSRSWVFRYRDLSTGKLRDKGLGPVHRMSLAEAREAARRARADLVSGIDPIDSARQQRDERRRSVTGRITFGECAVRYIETHRAAWRNAKHAAQWRSTLETHAATLMPMPVAEVGTDAVMQALLPIWTAKTETASRVRQRIEAVLDWANASRFRSGDNPARLRGHLENLLPSASKVKRVVPRPALPHPEMSRFLAALRAREGLAALALELQVLTATRPNEAVGARWDEFDLADGVWTIPAQRMKANRAHRVPLSAPVLSLLARIPRSGPYLFPSSTAAGHITTAATLKLVKSLAPGVVAHGFRSTFRDWCADCTGYPREVAEEALAHVLKDKTEAAYRRTDMLARRAKLMADWADHCERPADTVATVTSIPRDRPVANARRPKGA